MGKIIGALIILVLLIHGCSSGDDTKHSTQPVMEQPTEQPTEPLLNRSTAAERENALRMAEQYQIDQQNAAIQRENDQIRANNMLRARHQREMQRQEHIRQREFQNSQRSDYLRSQL